MTLRQVLGILVRDRSFRRYEYSFFTFGFANIMLLPVFPVFLERSFQASYFDASLALVAREAGGSMRDALSLLDQVMTCADGPVTHDQVLHILGVVDRQMLSTLADALLNGDVAGVLTAIQAVHDRGQDLKKLYADLLTHLRNLVVIKVGDPSMPLVDLPESEIDLLRDQIRRHSAGALHQVFKMVYRDETLVRLAPEPRLAVEMVLMQICQIKPALPMDELIDHVEALRQAILQNGSAGGEAWMSNSATQQARSSKAVPSTDGDVPSGEEDSSPPLTAMPGTPEERQAAWARILELIAKRLPALAASLQQSLLVNAGEGAFEIEINGNEFSINRIKRPESVEAIRSAIQAICGRSPEVVIHGVLEDPAAKREKKNHEDQLRQQALSHPMVSEVVELFQGKVMDVKVLPSAEKEGPA